MKIAFYQENWFGMDLKMLAIKLGHGKDNVANGSFYKYFYNQLVNNNFNGVTDEWIAKKHNFSDWLYSFLKNKNLDNGNILSIGCGLGIVEKPLIEKGLKIDLQECQDVSIKYFSNNDLEVFKKTNFILSEDLKEIKDCSYDVVMAITSTYCLKDPEMKRFLDGVHRLLKEKGIFIWYEVVLSTNDIIQNIKRIMRLRNHNGVLWGWKRSKKTMLKEAMDARLSFLESHYFDGNNKEINAKTFLEFPIGSDTHWQAMVFQKNSLGHD